jgi:hypothetical protein
VETKLSVQYNEYEKDGDAVEDHHTSDTEFIKESTVRSTLLRPITGILKSEFSLSLSTRNFPTTVYVYKSYQK